MSLGPRPPSKTIQLLTEITQSARSAEEEGDYLVFEQLVAEAALKKDKDTEKKHKKDKKEGHEAVAAAPKEE